MSDELQGILATGFETGALRVQPAMFLWGIIQTLAGLVLETAAHNPAKADDYKDLGWETLWGAIALHHR